MQNMKHGWMRGGWAIALASLSSVTFALLPGDANLDGTITPGDALVIQEHILGLVTLQGDALQNADGNGDGRVDVADILYVGAHVGEPADKILLLPGNVRLALVKIPHGSFQMGSSSDATGSAWPDPNEFPVHPVTIATDYYLGKFEVTQGQWLAVMGGWPDSIYNPDTPFGHAGRGPDFPMFFASWYDVQSFLTTLNGLGLGGTFRLPSEAEWEYGARGGTQTRFAFGDSTCSPGSCAECDLSQYAWWCENNVGTSGPGYGTKIVGRQLPNAYGLYDMAGNVLEMCQDWYHDSYTGAPADGSAWESPIGSRRVGRGGSWSGNSPFCRPSSRGEVAIYARQNTLGFRLAWTP